MLASPLNLFAVLQVELPRHRSHLAHISFGLLIVVIFIFYFYCSCRVGVIFTVRLELKFHIRLKQTNHHDHRSTDHSFLKYTTKSG